MEDVVHASDAAEARARLVAMYPQLDVRLFPDQTTIIRHGARLTKAIVLLQGAFECVLDQGPAKGFVACVGSSIHLLAHNALLGDEPATMTWRALGPARCAILQPEQVMRAMRQSPSIFGQWCKAASQNEAAFSVAVGASASSAEARLGRLIASYAMHCGRRDDDGVRLLVRRTQKELADAAGVTLRHVNRLLGRWSEQQLIVRRDQTWIVADAFLANSRVQTVTRTSRTSKMVSGQIGL